MLCQELQGEQNYCETCKQCDYEIEYADQSSSMGVLARDDMHLIATNGGREKLDFVFGYVQTFQKNLSSICLMHQEKNYVRSFNFCCIGTLGVHMISKASFYPHQQRLMGSLDLAVQL
jgi:hypothetical protein